MLSIIICSVSLDRLRAVQQNIKETIGIGVDYEIIAIDNREKHWPIAKVYNHGASQAKYPYLFFVHEDVKFHSQGWAEFIEQKLAEPDCGVIGFAGSKVKLRAYSGWAQRHEWYCSYYYQRTDSGDVVLGACGTCMQCPFEEVVVVDGFALFVRRDVWEENKFDEQLLTGFHCYDLDFSIVVSQKYKNYICCSTVLIEHFSMGDFDKKWFADTIHIHNAKWKNLLPLSVSGTILSEKDLREYEQNELYNFLFKLLRADSCDADKRKVLWEFWRQPCSWKHFSRCLTCTLKYLRTICG